MKSELWKDQALCTGSAVDFYSDEVAVIATAKLICSACPSRLACREAGMGEEWGVWGGLSRADRKAAKRLAKAS